MVAWGTAWMVVVVKRAFYIIITIFVIVVVSYLCYHVVAHGRGGSSAEDYLFTKVLASKSNLLLLANGSIVQLAGVYLPTHGENYRAVFADYLEEKVINKDAKIKIVSIPKVDYPKFPLAIVYIDRKELNAELVKEGMGYFDHGYFKGKERYKALQHEARKEKRGVWGSSNPPTPLFATKKKWKYIHHVDNPDVKNIPEQEKEYYYFVPEEIYGFKFFDLDTDYARTHKVKAKEYADWNIRESARDLEKLRNSVETQQK